MPEVWPPSLPQAFRLGTIEYAPDTAIRSQMDAGPTKVRRRFTAGPRRVETSLALPESALDVLMRFFETTLQDGALPFEHKRPTDPAGPPGSSPVLLRFTEPPSYRLVRGGSAPEIQPIWEATFRLEVLPPG